MSRLPSLHRDDLDAGGQALWDALARSRGAHIVDGEGALVGQGMDIHVLRRQR
jgi:hypothetical protein